MSKLIFLPQTSSRCGCKWCAELNAKHGTKKTWLISLNKKEEGKV
jgi:hypothetical protein